MSISASSRKLLFSARLVSEPQSFCCKPFGEVHVFCLVASRFGQSCRICGIWICSSRRESWICQFEINLQGNIAGPEPEDCSLVLS